MSRIKHAVGWLECPALLGNSLSMADALVAEQRLLQEALAIHSAGCDTLILDVYHAFEAAPGYADQREWLHLSHVVSLLRQTLPLLDLGLRVAFGEMEKAMVLLALNQVDFLCGHTFLQHEDVVHLEGLLKQYGLLDSDVWVQHITCNDASEWLAQQGQEPPYLKAYLTAADVEAPNPLPEPVAQWVLLDAEALGETPLPAAASAVVLATQERPSPFQRVARHPSWQESWPHGSTSLDPKRLEATLRALQ